MKRFVFAVLVVGMMVSIAYAQNDQASNNLDQQAPPAVPAAVSEPAETVTRPQDVSIYGEVKSVSQPVSSITVQYYDYDSDEEKTVEITTNANTKMENASVIGDIKQGNWVDVTYSVAGGVNLAKSIIVEKEEELPAVEMPKTEPAPKGGELSKQ